jgi:hypothetical protein
MSMQTLKRSTKNNSSVARNVKDSESLALASETLLGLSLDLAMTD